jgi:mRNA interferase HigB
MHSGLESALDTWYRIAKQARWRNLDDVRQVYPPADSVGQFTVFNIKGNSYRLITCIEYAWNRVFIESVLTHAEYSKGGWK